MRPRSTNTTTPKLQFPINLFIKHNLFSDLPKKAAPSHTIFITTYTSTTQSAPYRRDRPTRAAAFGN